MDSLIRQRECPLWFGKLEGHGVAMSIGHGYRNYFHRHIDSIPRVYGLWHPLLLAEPQIDLLVPQDFTDEEVDLNALSLTWELTVVNQLARFENT